MRHYFAYGSNMIADEMRRRCPDARESGTASLDDYALVIAESGYASIVRNAGSRVHGVLWEISESDERALDAYESVDEGLYRKDELRVGEVKALVYIETSEKRGHPLPGYLESIISAAEERGFPSSYISELRALRYNRDVAP